MIRRRHTDSSRPMCVYYILLFLLILLHTFTLLSLSVFLQTLWSDAWSVMFLGLGHRVTQRRCPSKPPCLVVVHHQLILHCDCCKTEDPCMQIVLQRLRVSFLIAEMNWDRFLNFSPPIKYMSMSPVPRMPKHALPCSCQKHEKIWHLFRCSPLLRCSVAQVNKLKGLQW